MALDVKVKIDLTKPIGSIGLGIPLIIEENSKTDIDYTECKALTDVAAAGFTDTAKVYKAVSVMFAQDNPPEKIAVCATAGTASGWLDKADNVNKNWRHLVVVTESETAVADIDIADEKSYELNDFDRTVLFYCEATEDYPSPVSALVGAAASLAAGSFTYKNMILKGISPQALSDSAVEAIHSKGGITFVTKAGDNVTTEGKTAGGEYIDIIDSKDYIISNLEYQTQRTLNLSDKISYDNNGIAVLENVAVNVMRDAYNKGIIATNADGTAAYAVSYAKREDTEASDRVQRRYIGGKFAFALAGAVHTVEITGEIII